MIKMPPRWAFKHGAYYYRPRKKESELFDGKSWCRLGKTYPEALRAYASRMEVMTDDTLGSLIDRYFLEVLPAFKPQTQIAYTKSLNRLREKIGRNPLRKITPNNVYKYLEEVNKAHGMNNANSDLKVINNLLNKGVRWGVVPKNELAGQVKYYGERDGLQKARDRYVEDWELAEWKKVATPIQLAFAALALLTGARKIDILKIKRSDVSEDELRVHDQKNKKPQIFIMTEELQQAIDLALSTHKGRAGFYLLVNRRGNCFVGVDDTCSSFDQSWQRTIRKAIKQTDLETPFNRHDLRAKVGSDQDTDERAQELLGHTDPSMTRKHYRRKIKPIKPTK